MTCTSDNKELNLIHSTIFYDRLTINIKQPNLIQKVLSFVLTKQLTRKTEKNEGLLNCKTSFTEFNGSIFYCQLYL